MQVAPALVIGQGTGEAPARQGYQFLQIQGADAVVPSTLAVAKRLPSGLRFTSAR